MSGVLPIVKLAVNVVSAAGVGKIVGDIVKNNVQVATTFDVVKVTTGGIVITSLIVDHTSKHVNSQIDKAVEWYEERKTAPEPEVVVQ